MTVLAATFTLVAMLLRRPSGRWWVRRRLGGVTVVPAIGARWLAVAGAVALVVGLTFLPELPGPRLAVILTIGGVVVFAGHQVRIGRARDTMRARRSTVVELLFVMAAEQRAGVLPARTLAGLAGDFPMLGPAARAADLGGDVAGVLREAGRVPGQELLADLGGAWHVSERSGAPLADVLTRLAESARIERDIVQEAESGVAPARATARLMALLPIAGLLLGSGLGGDPVAVLTGTWIGVACLSVGCAIACAGVAWIERIAASAVEA